MRRLVVLAATVVLVTGCRKPSEPADNGKIRVEFDHTVKGSPLITDTLMYTTSTSHTYKVTDLQYFVSDIILYHDKGRQLQLASGDGIHYADVRIPASLSWTPGDEIAPGTYDSLSFTFGISEAKNVSNRFPDPPERDMAWPDILGGGYHYMKMNLMYRDAEGTVTKPFMLHLGIGQLYSSSVPDPDSITGYVQNYFTVTLPVAFTINAGVVRTIRCTMRVDRWFDGPETFDFTDYPGGIMQYQEGMHRACLNGRWAFQGTALN